VSIGEKIVEERKRLGFTQAEFAQKLGVGLSTQKRYEIGERIPSMRYLQGFVALGGDAAYILAEAPALHEQKTPHEIAVGSMSNDADAQLSAHLVFTVLRLDEVGFHSAVKAIKAAPGTPEAMRAITDAIISNSPPLRERLRTTDNSE